MALKIYGTSPRASLVTKAGPGVGKSGQLLPYGAQANGRLVSKVLNEASKREGKVVRLNAPD